MPASDRSAIVVCVGNELIADDAAGFEVYSRLRNCGARLEYCGVGGIDLLPLLTGETDLIVVDAVQLGAPPGTIHIMPWDSLPAGGSVVSAHGLGLRETVEIGRILCPEVMPERITLVGIEGCCFNLTREHMTPQVEKAIDVAVEKIYGLLQGGS